jgi:hypothetical protein
MIWGKVCKKRRFGFWEESAKVGSNGNLLQPSFLHPSAGVGWSVAGMTIPEWAGVAKPARRNRSAPEWAAGVGQRGEPEWAGVRQRSVPEWAALGEY